MGGRWGQKMDFSFNEGRVLTVQFGSLVGMSLACSTKN